MLRVARLVALLACCAAFWLNVQRSEALGMTATPPIWAVDAMPPAVSSLVFGHPIRYTSLTAVRERFYQSLDAHGRNAAGIDRALADVAELEPSEVGTEYRLLGPEDKGIVDFVEAAFAVFGLHTRAVAWLYFAVILTSGIALLVGMRGDLAIAAWLGAFLIAHALVMPMVTYNPQLGSYIALRSVPVISMIGCFHLLVFMLRPSARPLDITLVALQALLIVFAIHLRSTAQWQVACVTLATLTLLAVRWYRDRFTGLLGALRQHAATGIPLAFLALALVGLQAYRSFGYPGEYQRGDQILTRVFWHNIVSGLAFHPTFGPEHDLHIDDVSVIRAVGRYLRAQERTAEWVAMRGEISGPNGLRRTLYDPAARDFLIDQCRARIDVCVTTTLYYKPQSLLESLQWLGGFRELPPNLDLFVSPDWGDGVRRQMIALSARLQAEDAYARLWKPEALFVWGLVTAALALGSARLCATSMIASLALVGGSLLTSIVGYPAPWTVVESALAVIATLYLTVGLAVAWMARRWMARRLAHAVSRTGLPGQFAHREPA